MAPSLRSCAAASVQGANSVEQVIVDGCGHFVPLEQPATFWRLMADQLVLPSAMRARMRWSRIESADRCQPVARLRSVSE